MNAQTISLFALHKSVQVRKFTGRCWWWLLLILIRLGRKMKMKRALNHKWMNFISNRNNRYTHFHQIICGHFFHFNGPTKKREREREPFACCSFFFAFFSLSQSCEVFLYRIRLALNRAECERLFHLFLLHSFDQLIRFGSTQSAVSPSPGGEGGNTRTVDANP